MLTFLLLPLYAHGCAAAVASTFAGAPSSAVYPPPNLPSDHASAFPDGPQVGYPGPTPTGDEANVIATAPAMAKIKDMWPLTNPKFVKGAGRDFDVMQHAAHLSPFNSVDSFGLDTSPQIPKSCSLKQVHLLHRHGARYPTEGAAPAAFSKKLNAAATADGGFTATKELKFLNTWTYKLGGETLTPFGRAQLFNLGVGFRVRYGELLKGFKRLPVFRTTSQNRMLESALNFAAGFFGLDYQKQYHQLITIEHGTGFNNTLNPQPNCPNGNNAIADYGKAQARKWADIYLQRTVKRMQKLIKGSSSLKFEVDDMIAMQQLCAYETVALGYSEFCGLFTKKEWEGFAYFYDLDFWYRTGPGNPAASAQGIGYVEELVSRLTQTRITECNSSLNCTNVQDDVTFPLDQPIYVDATHDTAMTEIYTAMNFTSFTAGGPLPTDHIPVNQTYSANKLSPFAANLVGQVVACGEDRNTPSHIRWILNDGVVPLTGIRGCAADKDGLCSLPEFINGMRERIKEVDYRFDCFGNYTVPSPNTIIDGRFPESLRVTSQ
ncbi:hypothetical protein HGRIS_008053 [Hohenbuehelia grisea]|uniref:Phosphoglycerate mutase-like protein n=1 Tax=Hohenbuehelia grisea TaxID=104357 RepID=A0ABR3J6S5_9AGAR